MTAQTRQQALTGFLTTQESLPTTEDGTMGYLKDLRPHEERAAAILEFLGLALNEAMPQVAIIDVAIHAFEIPKRAVTVDGPTGTGSEATDVTTKAVLRSIKFLGLDTDDVSQVLRLSLGDAGRFLVGMLVLSRAGASYGQALLLVRLYLGMVGMVGGDEGPMRSWLRSVNKELGGNIPIQLMRSEHLEDVVTYVEGCAGKI